MSLIIKDKIQQMFVGYPTKAQNYNVAGGILSGDAPAKFGDIVCFDGDGFYRPYEAGDTFADIAGFILATNVKQAEGFGTNVVQVNPGEAFNLCLYDSYLAVEVELTLGEGETPADYIVPKAQVYVRDANGTHITAEDFGDFALDGVIFTGRWEMHGSKIVAEIYVK